MAKVVLHQPPRLWGLPNPSPFCVKVETWLRLAKVDYVSTHANMLKAPRGKVPWIVDDGTLVSDSEAIINHLEASLDDPLGEASLAPDLRAQHHAVRRMLENGTYWLSFYERWVSDEHWATTRAAFFDPLGFPMGTLVGAMIRRRVARDAHGQGVSRYEASEREAMGISDWEAVEAVLGDAPFFGGAAPRRIDCAVYGFVCQALWAPFETSMARYVRGRPRLVAYGERMRALAWTEIPKAVRVP